MALMLTAIGAVSLLVGGVGIMNIMLVSVTERRREIGVRMAIGARVRDIRWQFLIEAGALGLVGGIVGVALGWVGALVLSAQFDWPTPCRRSWCVPRRCAIGAGLVFGYCRRIGRHGSIRSTPSASKTDRGRSARGRRGTGRSRRRNPQPLPGSNRGATAHRIGALNGGPYRRVPRAAGGLPVEFARRGGARGTAGRRRRRRRRRSNAQHHAGANVLIPEVVVAQQLPRYRPTEPNRVQVFTLADGMFGVRPFRWFPGILRGISVGSTCSRHRPFTRASLTSTPNANARLM